MKIRILIDFSEISRDAGIKVTFFISFLNHLDYNYPPFPRYILYHRSSISASLGVAGLEPWKSGIIALKGFPETAMNMGVKIFSNTTKEIFYGILKLFNLNSSFFGHAMSIYVNLYVSRWVSTLSKSTTRPL